MKIINELKTSTDLTFTSWGNETLSLELNQLQHVLTSKQKQLILLKATASPIVMGQIFDERWFHYDEYVMLHDVNFNEEQTITITLVLSQAITEHFVAAQAELDELLFSLLDLDEKQFPSLQNGEYWFLTEASQKLQLPAALADQAGSSLKQGFKTVWYTELMQQPFHERKLILSDYSALPLFDQVTGELDFKGYSWQRYNEQIIQMTLSENNFTWAELIRVDEQARMVLFYAVFPYKITDEMIQKLSYILLNENYNMINGAFELDLEDGELRFRTSLFAPEVVQQAAIHQILHDHREIMSLYIPAIEQYSEQ